MRRSAATVFPLHPRLKELNSLLEDGFELADIASGPTGMAIELRRGLMRLTLRVDRREAAEILLEPTVPRLSGTGLPSPN